MAGYDDEDENAPNGDFPPYFDPDKDEWIEPGEEDEDDDPFDEDAEEEDLIGFQWSGHGGAND